MPLEPGRSTSEFQTATPKPTGLVPWVDTEEIDPAQKDKNATWDMVAQVLAVLGGGGAFTIDGITEFRDRFGASFTGSAAEAFTQLLVRYQTPAPEAFTFQGISSRDVEVGTPFTAGLKTFGWAISNPQNVKPGSIAIEDVTSNTELAANLANDGTEDVQVPAFTAVLGETRRFRLSGENTNDQAFEALNIITGRYLLGFGAVAAAPTTSAQARALNTQLAQDSGAFTLNTGTTHTRFAVVLPPGKVLQSVTDIDNQNLNLTAKYELQPLITVNDAAGNPVANYRLYLLAQATPYTVNARHVVTYGS